MNDHFIFSKLADVYSAPLKTSLTFFCVVVECQTPLLTKTEKYFVNLRLACTTLPEGETVEVTVFSRRKDGAPRIQSPGEIALITNAVVREYDGERCLKLDSSHGGCMLFDQNDGDGRPYTMFGAVKFPEIEIEEMLKTVRVFSRLWRMDYPDHFISEQEKRIEEIEGEVENIDIGCFVISANLHSDPKLLWVWDGTDIQPQSIRQPDSVRCSTLGPTFGENCKSIEHPCQTSDRGEEVPIYGTLIPVAVVAERRFGESPSGWIKLRNVTVIRYCSQILLLYHDDTRWSPVPQMPSLCASYNERLERNRLVKHCDTSAIGSRVIGHPHTPLTSLRAIRAFLHNAAEQQSSVQQVFQCYIYIIAYKPDLDTIVQALTVPGHKTAIHFTIQDGTDHLNATLYGKHAERFFEPHLERDQKEREEQIREVFHKACTYNNPVPWYSIYVKAIYRNGTTAVQILDTVLC